MFAIAFLTKKLLDSSIDGFFDHYGQRDFPRAAKLPRLASYNQAAMTHGDHGWSRSESTGDYDAFSLYAFASREVAEAAFVSPAEVALDGDADLFIDRHRSLSILVDQLRGYVGSKS